MGQFFRQDDHEKLSFLNLSPGIARRRLTETAWALFTFRISVAYPGIGSQPLPIERLRQICRICQFCQ